MRPERGVLSAERQRLRLVAKARRRRGGVEEGPAIDPLHAVGLPELQRVGCAELDGAERIGDAEEVAREDVRRRPVEAPVRQRDARIDRLKLALEIEQVGAVPRQKARRAMGLRRAHVGVHVAEVGEAAQALIVELRERRHETVAFSRRQRVGVLSDAHHHRHRADQRGADARLDFHITVVDAGLPEFAGDEERNGSAVGRDRKRQAVGERSRCATPEDDGAAASHRYSGDSHTDGRRGGARRIGHANPARRWSPRHELRSGAHAVVDLQFNVHCHASWAGHLRSRESAAAPKRTGVRMMVPNWSEHSRDNLLALDCLICSAIPSWSRPVGPWFPRVRRSTLQPIRANEKGINISRQSADCHQTDMA